MNKHKSANQNRLIISISVIAIILASYWQVQNYGFISYDDQLYIVDNYRIHSGFTFKSIVDALTNVHTGHWHPLTIMSHMLDWNLFGDNAGGHHWTSVIIHILNAVLLFLFFQYLTGAIWKSAFIAALFAIHPINVESVAWIAERKNVLSTFFWILTMFLYVWYVRSPSWKRYLPMFLCFALGLMAKPMLVTLPFVLLLLDYWPLNRTIINQQNKNQAEIPEPISLKKYKITSLIWEKVPLLFLTAISICLTFYAAKSVGTIASLNILPLNKRISNAIVSYALYLKKLFWPIDLAVFYPHLDLSLWQVSVAALFLLIITIIVCKYFHKYPYLPVGWFWYLGTLVPVIGIVQVGGQAMADRYAYLPFIGLFIIVTWGAADIFKKRISIKIIAMISALIILALTVVAHCQVKYWRDTFTLFSHTLNVTKNNFIAHNGMASELLKQDKIEEAITHYNVMLILDPKSDIPLVGIGRAFSIKGENDAAIATFRQALKLNPESIEAHHNLGFVLFQMGRLDEAIAEYQKAIELNGDNPTLYNNLGNAFAKQGKDIEAIKAYNAALLIRPRDAGAHNNLGMVLMHLYKYDEAIRNFKEAIHLQPEYANAHFYLSEILKRKGLSAEAEYHLNEAIRINSEYKNIDKLQSRHNIGK